MRASFVVVVAALAACRPSAPATPAPGASAQIGSSRIGTVHPADSGERHLRNLRQLTDGGENAEAYFSADDRWITFQSTRDGRRCDQQYVMRTDGTGLRRVSDGRGKTTCGWFLPGGERLFYASTTHEGEACPAKPDPSKGYVWGIDKYDIYTVGRDGRGQRRLTNYGVYTAEGVLSPDGTRIVFFFNDTATTEIYTMNVDGTDARRSSTAPGTTPPGTAPACAPIASSSRRR